MNLFDETTIAAIHNIPRWSMGHKDKWIWLYSNSGTLTVKSTYKVGTKEDHSTPNDPILGKIWKQNIHVRLKMLLWRVALNLLPTKASLSRFAPDLYTTCPLCGEHTESTIHLLWQCSLTRALWFNSSWWIKTDSFFLNSPKHLLEALITPPLRLELDKFQADKFLLTGAFIIDQVWKL